uniref:Uncharacterized protein n=1 Tax=Magnetococcus massalia (strain MO-1) TaxID=451514 RepID=A0A1S7LDG2_MAGMO|nr:protein of unknown function [Candidatus Magnetococcus massalia]
MVAVEVLTVMGGSTVIIGEQSLHHFYGLVVVSSFGVFRTGGEVAAAGIAHILILSTFRFSCFSLNRREGSGEGLDPPQSLVLNLSLSSLGRALSTGQNMKTI